MCFRHTYSLKLIHTNSFVYKKLYWGEPGTSLLESTFPSRLGYGFRYLPKSELCLDKATVWTLKRNVIDPFDLRLVRLVRCYSPQRYALEVLRRERWSCRSRAWKDSVCASHIAGGRTPPLCNLTRINIQICKCKSWKREIGPPFSIINSWTVKEICSKLLLKPGAKVLLNSEKFYWTREFSTPILEFCLVLLCSGKFKPIKTSFHMY